MAMFVIGANASQSVIGAYHADTRSNWGWTLVLGEGYTGKIIFTEYPNECGPCEKSEVIEQGVWSVSEGKIMLVLSSGREYMFAILDEEKLLLIEPRVSGFDPEKFVFLREI